MTDLKPCPHCAYDDPEYDSDVWPKEFAVICPNCGAIGPVGDDMDQAAVLWNQRRVKFEDAA